MSKREALYALRISADTENTWLLSNLRDSEDKKTSLSRLDGSRCEASLPLRADTYSAGPRTVAHIGDTDVLFLRKDVAQVLEEDINLQCLPVLIDDSDDDYVAINVLRLVDCVAHDQVSDSRFPDDFPNVRARGQYRTLNRVVLRSEAVPTSGIFRLVDLRAMIIAPNSFRELLQRHAKAGLGVTFDPVILI